MQTVYARGGSQQREVADGANVVFTDTGFAPKTFCPWTYSTFPAYSPSFGSIGCFQLLVSQCACHAELKIYLLTYLPEGETS